jgi:kynurenine formamidase
MTGTAKCAPSHAEWLEYFESLSNWGRWGAEDVRGTLNLIDEAKVRAAAGLVTRGVTVSCARTIEFGGRGIAEAEGNRAAPLHFMSTLGSGPGANEGFAADWLGMPLHGKYVTHIDAFSHMFWKDAMYNGHSASLVSTNNGARIGSTTPIEQGVVSRGVILDIAGYMSVEWLEEGYPVDGGDLEGAAERQGVEIEPGDIVFVRTGYGKWRRDERHPKKRKIHFPGMGPGSLPWLRAHDVAIIGTDTATETEPTAYGALAPFHQVALCAMGLWIVDCLDLESVREMCMQEDRWTCLLTIAPLRLKNATGCPINPIATF